MIDLDWLDEQLEQALSDEVRCARRGLPAPAPAPAAHALPARGAARPVDGRDPASQATLRALLDGREADARAGVDQVLALGRQAGDPDAWTRYLSLRFRIVLEWGTEEERDELLDQCRARAYWFDEIPWRAALTLLLARLGKTDEAIREFDITLDRGRAAGLPAPTWLDIVTDLADAATALGDPRRASVAQRARAA